MGKGDWYRPVDRDRYADNYDRIFGSKKLNVWEDKDEVPGDTGDGEKDREGCGQAPNVPQESRGDSDSGTEGTVEKAS